MTKSYIFATNLIKIPNSTEIVIYQNMKLSILKKKISAVCIITCGVTFSLMAQTDSASTAKVDTAYAAPQPVKATTTADSAAATNGASAIDAVLDFTADSTISSALDTMQFDNILNSLDAKTDSVKKVVDAIDKSTNPTPSAGVTTTPATEVSAQKNPSVPASGTKEVPAQTETSIPVPPPAVNDNVPAPNEPPVKVIGGIPENANPTIPVTNTDVIKTSTSPGAETGEPAAPVINAENKPTETPVTTATNAVDTTKAPATVATTPTRTDEEAPAVRSKVNTFRGLKKFNNISVGVNAGAVFVDPFGSNDFDNNHSTGAGGINLTYFLGRAMALQANFTYNSELRGDSIKSDLVKYNIVNAAQYPQFGAKNYRTTSMDYSLSLLFNLGNVSFLTKKPSVGFYATVGLGMVSFESKTYDAANALLLTSGKQNRMMIPIGFGVKYKLTNNLTANVNYTLKLVESDQFDNLVANGNNDKYSYTSVGVAYTLGKKNKPSVEWTNPVVGLYEDLSDNKMRRKLSSLQEQLDSLKQNVTSQLDSLKMDDDQDGVPNFLDKQPNTPKGAMVDGAGRSIDSDGDGVPDNLDKCPFEKGDPLYDGCKKNVVELSPEAKDILEDASDKLKFKVNSAVIKSGAHKSLKKLVDFLNKNEKYKLFIAGHTDSDGPEKLNDVLSLNRAEAVKAFLVRNGIANERIIAKGLGKREPIANNDTPEGKQINRTVVFQVVAY
jgi:OOP family OmpA-OmpF porin